MINSILIFLSSYNKSKKVPYICMGLWLLYLLLTTKFEYGFVYPLVSASLFLITALVINLFAKNKIANSILSVSSVLIWSILIDFVCYFIFPTYSEGMTIVSYIMRGIIFNYKYVILNVIVLLLYNGLEILINKFVLDKTLEHIK